MITLENVHKSYDGKAAVEGIDLQVPAGAIYGLIGPNGAGKTTTLKMVSTLIKPDSGRISVGGRDLATEGRQVRRILGYMPDQFGHFRTLSCEEYLEYFGRAYSYHGSELRSRIEAVLELTDLLPMRDESANALSTGMRQRLALAKTLLHDPEVLILDEPASGLDPRARIEIRSLLKELGRMGKTVIISSHILADLEEICTDAAIIELGRVVWSGNLVAVKKELRAARFGFTLEVPDEQGQRAVDVLKTVDGVEEARLVTTPGLRIEGKMAGKSSRRVLQALLAAELDVVSFAQEKVDLEAVFLERTRGIVS